MKNLKWLVASIVLVSLLFLFYSCAPGALPKSSVVYNIVEVVSKTDGSLSILTEKVDDYECAVFWYNTSATPTGFTLRNALLPIPRVAISPESPVYLNNIFIESLYHTNVASEVINSINSGNNKDKFLSKLSLKLIPTGLMGSWWDLEVKDGTDSKVEITPYKYVLVRFIKTNVTNLYVVDHVWVAEWSNLNPPKNIPVSDLVNKGFALFKIDPYTFEMADACVVLF